MKTFSGLPSVQVESEFQSFLDLVKSENIKSYAEIGTGRGDTFHSVVSSLPKESLAVAVDLPESGWGLGNSRMYLSQARKDLKEKGYDVKIIWGDSKYQGVIDNFNQYTPFDLVFIDGDHSYDGVKSDWENYGKGAKIVAFHDISYEYNPQDPHGGIEVKRFWEELKKEYRHQEFIERPGHMGIGVVWLC